MSGEWPKRFKVFGVTPRKAREPFRVPSVRQSPGACEAGPKSVEEPMSKHSPGPWRWVERDNVSHVTMKADALEDANGREVVCGWTVAARGFVSCSSADARLIAKAPALLAMVRELEWSGGETGDLCPLCGKREVSLSPMPGWDTAHAPDCRLAALLAEVSGEAATKKPDEPQPLAAKEP